MKNTFGNSVSVTIFGESHGAELGAIIDGLAPGIVVDQEFIAHQLDLRRPVGKISTARHEADAFRIVSGVFEGKTTGTPVTILVPNTSQHSKDYAATRALARPGHADYTAFAKYHGYEDYRGGGHFSGRITAGLVAAGAIALTALANRGIYVGTHIARCAGIPDAPFAEGEALTQQLKDLNQRMFATLDEEAGNQMREAIAAAAADHDSVGGVLETAITGVPAGVGEPWFDSLESVLSHGLFSIGGIKGVQFGGGFDLADVRGSQYNDPFRMTADGTVVTTTNNNGGINGGISNGMPITFRCAVKPTPSIYQPQETVDFMAGENAQLEIVGRHDPAIIHRARVVVDSVTALALCDLLALRFGTDWLAGEAE